MNAMRPVVPTTTNRLRGLREFTSETQKAVGAIVGVDGPTYRRWERGDERLPDEAALRLAEHYHVSISWVKGWA